MRSPLLGVCILFVFIFVQGVILQFYCPRVVGLLFEDLSGLSHGYGASVAGLVYPPTRSGGYSARKCKSQIANCIWVVDEETLLYE